jgi:hypothetical protein
VRDFLSSKEINGTMNDYFKYNEVGKIMSILRDKFNLFQKSKTQFERKPLYKQKSKLQEINTSYFDIYRERSPSITS